MAELADAPALGAGVHDVQVQLLSSAPILFVNEPPKAMLWVSFMSSKVICSVLFISKKLTSAEKTTLADVNFID